MHIQAKIFTLYVKEKFPNYFQTKRVLDCGSGDINGNNKELFDNCQYIGIDVMPATNVDVVSRIAGYKTEQFDTIISTECFEHDIEFIASIKNIVENLLKNEGLFAFTCASIGRGEHGTYRLDPQCSYTTIAHQINNMTVFNEKNWYPNYYHNLHYKEIFCADVLHYFSRFEMSYNEESKDLYFWGIKKVIPEVPDLHTNDMVTIFDKHNTDKNSSFHNYPSHYNKFLLDYRYKNINLLEIGVYEGQSLCAFREYFKNAIHIVGIDINPWTLNYAKYDFNIHIEIGNQNSPEFLQKVSEKYSHFDIIVDDGSHRLEDIIISFETLFPLMKDKGVYIIEDVICIRDNMNYFFELTKKLNRWRKDWGGDHCVDPNKFNVKFNDWKDYSISDIIFTNSAILIYKNIIPGLCQN